MAGPEARKRLAGGGAGPERNHRIRIQQNAGAPEVRDNRFACGFDGCFPRTSRARDLLPVLTGGSARALLHHRLISVSPAGLS